MTPKPSASTVQNELIREVAQLQAARETLLRQQATMCEKLDSLATEMRQTLGRFGDRIGGMEREVSGMKARCDAFCSDRERRYEEVMGSIKEHDKGLRRLWEIEHNRRGKIAIIAAVGGFGGTVVGGLLIAAAKELLTK